MGLKSGMLGVVEKVFNISTAKVVRIKELTKDFKLIEWTSEGFKKAEWSPGDKIQIGLNLQFRTYTPILFKQDNGRLEILTYLHNTDSQAGNWIRSLKVGYESQCLAPRIQTGVLFPFIV